jgi:formimidoylglutamate deiminase
MKFFAHLAWINGRWESNVELTAGEDGLWKSIKADSTNTLEAESLGVILPGLTDAHSHAFQRAMAGVSERGSGSGDNFWRWRQAMYQVALKITPDQLERIATWLYAELLSQGYTHLCEFHYVHHAPDGQRYADPAEMSWALVRAANNVGIGLTLLPTLYQHHGFDRQGLRPDQRRFNTSPDFILGVRDAVLAYSSQQRQSRLLNAGVAAHSLRAVDELGLRDLLRGSNDHPIHMHISEQMQEVNDCLLHTGQRPVQWLTNNVDLDKRWNLVHATHTVASELQGLASANASVVICPITEANLGDGIFDFTTALDLNLNCSIGTDSHTNRDWSGELRSLEYSLRLTQQARNIASRAGSDFAPTGQVLFDLALKGGSAAAGQPLGGIAVGQRADFFEIETDRGPLAGMAREHLIDATIFSTPSIKPRQVIVAGRKRHPNLDQITATAVRTMHELWGQSA